MIEQLAKAAYDNALMKGFHDGEDCPPDNRTVAEKLALIHSEVSEALECVRVGEMKTMYRAEDGKPEGFFPELADILIRVFDLAGSFPQGAKELAKCVDSKMKFNTGRSYKHGKQF